MLDSKLPQLKIRTAEGVVFSQTLAGPLSRMLAMALDIGCVVTAVSVLGKILIAFRLFSTDLYMASMIAIQFVVPVIYGMVCEYFWNGQTIGKRIFRLRVVDIRGLRLHFSQVGIRNLLRVVDGLPLFYAVGGISCLLSSRCQRLGDIAANTVVIRIPKLTQPDLEKIGSTKYN